MQISNLSRTTSGSAAAPLAGTLPQGTVEAAPLAPVDAAGVEPTSSSPPGAPPGELAGAVGNDPSRWDGWKGGAARVSRRGQQAASDVLGGFQIFSAVSATGALGWNASMFAGIWGTVFGGIGTAIGGLTAATSAAGEHRTRRAIRGGLGIAAGISTMATTLGILSGTGVLATAALVCGKTVYEELACPA